MMQKNVSIILMIALISFLGKCSFFKNSPEKVLIGTWAVSSYISPAEVAKKSEGPMPAGMSMEMSMTGSTTYHVGYKYSQDGEVILRVRKGEKEVALRFYVRDAGVWEIHDDVLVETSGDSSVTALDETTKGFLEATPEFKSMISPIKGDSTSYKLKEVSDSKVLLEEKEYGSTIVLQKKG